MSVDDPYQAFFNQVAVKNESYEKFVENLPTVKAGETLVAIAQPVPNGLPAPPGEGANEVQLMQLHRIFRPPPVADLRKEWEAAAEEDDLSTEEGEWEEIDASKTKEPEVVDELGIPVETLNNAASSCFLDGPGGVKVDNFCVDGDGGGSEAETGAEADPPASSQAQSDATASGKTTAAVAPVPTVSAESGYVPSAIAKATGAAGSVALSPQRPLPHQHRQHATAPPVQTLEDEIRAAREKAAAACPPTAATATAAAADADASTDAAGPASGPSGVQEREQEELPDSASEPEPATESEAAVASSSGAVLLPAATAAGGAAAGAAASLPVLDLLPGECPPEISDIEAEVDTAQLLHAVDQEQGMLQQLGLTGPEDSQPEGARRGQEQGQRQEQAAQQGVDQTEDEPSADGHFAAAPQPHEASSGSGAAAPQQPQPEATAPGAAAEAAAAATPVGSAADQGTSSGTAAANEPGASGSTVPHHPRAQPETSHTDEPEAASQGSPSQDEDVSFVEVEPFSLDPTFDYDNVELTPREWPYSRLGQGGRPWHMPH